MTEWSKIPKAPYYLEIWKGPYRTSYRVIYRANGIAIREVLEERDRPFATWKDALAAADKLIAERRFGPKAEPKALIRSEVLCDEIVSLKEADAEATRELAEIMMRKHLKPFLNGICSYSSNCEFSIYLESGACPVAADLNVTHYLAYKTHFRKHRPRGALFNHWKYWTMLFTHAFNKGLIKAPVKIEFDEEKEDFRKRGQLIPDALFKAIIVSANRTWRHRAVVGRLCGQRPGVVRKLRKDQVDLSTGLMRVEKADSKNRRAYSFYLPPAAVRELQAQAERYPDSPYFFPNELDHSKPMDKHLKGWHAAIGRAQEILASEAATAAAVGDSNAWLAKSKLAKSFPPAGNPWTPHDLRHTRLTELGKTSGINHAVTCYQHDLSLDEWMATYAHFEASDTLPISEDAERRAQSLLSDAVAVQPVVGSEEGKSSPSPEGDILPSSEPGKVSS